MSEPGAGIPRPPARPEDFDGGVHLHTGYADALAHLYGRLNTEALDPASFARIDRSLDAFRRFLARLNDPHLGRPTVHITGTRGKGSTLAMLEAILNNAGIRTGSTVSPHLVEVRERIRIAGQDLDRAAFADLYALIRPHADAMMDGINYRTVFELLTALAFVSFRECEVQAALVEVGMGGKLDATNVVEPTLSIITRVGLDHTHILGDTVEAIAEDKSHIIKSEGPAVVSRQTGRVLSVLEDRARAVGVDLWALDREIETSALEVSHRGTSFDLTTPLRSHRDLCTPLLGEHQAENAAVAVAAADRLHADGVFTIPADAVRDGLRETRWPGRAEILARDPVVMLDGAHTDQGAGALHRLLSDAFPDRNIILVLGMNRDKDPRAFLDALSLTPARVLATRAESPRSLPASELQDIVRSRGIPCDTVELEDAIDAARAVAARDDLILATGSFYVIGTLRRVWLRAEAGNSTF